MRFGRRRAITFVAAQVYGGRGLIASSLRIAGSRVVELNCAPHRGDSVIDLSGALVLPGLINAHDHLELNNFPRLKWRDRYSNASEWIADFQPRFEEDRALADAMAVPLENRLLIGGVKNLLCGVTVVCHHNPLYRSLGRGFPVRVVRRFRYSHSLLMDGERVRREYRKTPPDWPWIIHAAEGIDSDAAKEYSTLDRWGCLGSNTVLVHGVALGEDALANLAGRGGALIWCPSSNDFLFGATPDVAWLSSVGRVALGSDSRLTGERDLLGEMKFALRHSRIGAEALVRMVTVDAAAVLMLPRAGELRSGAPADLLILPAGPGNPIANVPEATRSDIRLVMIDGLARIGDADMSPAFTASGVAYVEARLDGRTKLMSRRLAERIRGCRAAEPGLEL